MKLTECDFRFFFEIDYDRTSCTGCTDYCRCSRICDPRIVDIPSPVEVVQEIIRRVYPDWSIITEYCIDRLLFLNKVYASDSFHIGVCGGYYGEEIDSVTIDNNSAQTQIDQLLKLKKNSDKIEFVLNAEYGYLPEDYKGLNWTVKKIKMSDLILGQKEYLKKLDKDKVKEYKEYSLPRGICVPTSDDKYRLVDGYHRCSANEGKTIQIIVGEKK